jgi:hypothetical protein
MAKYAKYQVDDDDLDENGLLKDQHSLRVPMWARDANLTDLQRAVRDHARQQDRERRQQRVQAADGNPLSLHRPGGRYLADDTLYDEAERAFREMVADTANRWRRGPQQQYDARPPVGSYGPFEARRIGEACTLDGQPGTLVASADGKWLLCKPSSRSGADSVPRSEMSLADAEAIKQQAYDEMRAAQRDAWRHPGSAW